MHHPPRTGRTRGTCGPEDLVENLAVRHLLVGALLGHHLVLIRGVWYQRVRLAALSTWFHCAESVVPVLVAVLDVDVEVGVEVGVDELGEALDELGRGQSRDIDPHVLLRFVAQFNHVLVGNAGHLSVMKAVGGTRSVQLVTVESLAWSQFRNRMSENGCERLEERGRDTSARGWCRCHIRAS